MDDVIKYLEFLLYQKEHFNFIDEFGSDGIKNIQELLYDHKILKGVLNEEEFNKIAPQVRWENVYEYLRTIQIEYRNEIRRTKHLKKDEFILNRIEQEIIPRLREKGFNLELDNKAKLFYMTNGKVTIVRNIIDFIKEFQSMIFLDNGELFYRGHSNASFMLIPSIYRKANILNEKRMYYNITSSLPLEVRDSKTTLDVLAKMQHFEAPTRLLDITTNPLVALYFACQDLNKNGELLVFSVKEEKIKLYDSDTISLLTNLCKMNRNFNTYDTKYFNINNIYGKELLNKVREEKSYFQPDIIQSDINKCFFIKPKLDNPRIIRQSGAFIVSGINGHILLPSEEISQIEREVFQRFIIPLDFKTSIINDLDKMSISSSTLFPELSVLSSYFKKKFSMI